MQFLNLNKFRQIFVTGDTHYGHRNILQYCMRPWLTDSERDLIRANEKIKVSDESLAAHDNALVDNINALCTNDDALVHVGDVAWGVSKLEEFLDRVNCKNVYVTVGNHDDAADLLDFLPRRCVAERFMIELNNQRAVIDHYPGDSWQDSHKGTWQLFGHIHGIGNTRRKQNPSWALSLDVGVDSHDYKPWSWDELTALLNARKYAWLDWRASLRDKSRGGMERVGAV